MGLAQVYYKIRKPMCKNREVNMDVSVANEVISAMHPDKQSTCIVLGLDNFDIAESDLDIIMPVYNAEKYVRKAIESVLNQKSKYKIRLIIVNDGSHDKSTSIINEYLEDERVVLIDKDNGGIASARNAGLDKSNARYIMFLDSDDYIPDGCLDELINDADANQADIIEGGYDRVTEEGIERTCFRHADETVKSYTSLYGYPWGKLYKKSLWDRIRYADYAFEDTLGRVIIYPMAKRICTTSACTYVYRENKKSVSFTLKKEPKCLDTYWIMRALLEDRKRLDIPLEMEFCTYFVRYICLSYRRTEELDAKYRKALFILFSELYENELKNIVADNNLKDDIYDALANKNYDMYELYCKTH